MTTNNPDAIRADIENTRSQLSDDVNALAEQTNPKNIAENQVQKVKDKVADARDAVFGNPNDPWDDGKVGDATQALSDRTPDRRSVERATRGHPLAAGLIAFGIGALIGGIAPSSRAEQQAATKLKDQAQPLVEDVKQAAKESAEQLKAPAQQAVAEVKDHAAVAGQRLKDDASYQAETVKAQAAESKDVVAGQVAESRDHVSDPDPVIGEENPYEGEHTWMAEDDPARRRNDDLIDPDRPVNEEAERERLEGDRPDRPFI